LHIITYFLGDIAERDFAYWYRCYRSVVCLSRSCIVLKRQKISTRFLLHMTAITS